MLYKRGKVYYVKLKHKGSVIRKSTGATNKRDAERIQEQWRAELKTIRKASGHTFEDATMRWLKEKRHKRSIETDMIVLKWFAPRLEHMTLAEITRDRIDELREELKEGRTESSVNRYFQVLRAILRTAKREWKWLDDTPHVPMYEKMEREPRFLSWEEFLALQENLPLHLKQPAWFSVSTGLRTAAIQKLQWNWINRSGLTIPASVQKNKASLTIPLSQTAWYVVAQQWMIGRSCGHPDALKYVFVTDAFTQWSRGKFTTKAWKKAAIRAGLPDVTFHDLRHTWASWMLQRGVPPHVVQELGGWKDSGAMRIYARFDTGSLERLAQYL